MFAYVIRDRTWHRFISICHEFEKFLTWSKKYFTKFFVIWERFLRRTSKLGNGVLRSWIIYSNFFNFKDTIRVGKNNTVYKHAQYETEEAACHTKIFGSPAPPFRPIYNIYSYSWFLEQTRIYLYLHGRCKLIAVWSWWRWNLLKHNTILRLLIAFYYNQPTVIVTL